MHDNSPFGLKKLIKILSKQFGMVFGYEIHNNTNNDVLRVCFESGYRFDLTIIYPAYKESQIGNISFINKADSIIKKFWFMAFMVLVKLGRKDYLVAAHLVLELCQLNIVIQMLIRDNIKNTDIHRFGNAEDVPILHSLIQLKVHEHDEIDKNVNRAGKLKLLQAKFYSYSRLT